MTDFTVPSGITSSGITVSNGDTWIIDGTAVSFTVSNGGIEAVSSGGSAVSTTVSSGGVERVYSSGTVTSTTVLSSGVEIISGGTATSTTVNNGGYEYVYSGGTTIGTTVSSGGNETVFSGSTAISTVVSSGGYEALFKGSDVSTTVGNSGTQVVLVDGRANDAVVDSGGVEFVSALGATYSTTVESGGIEIVSSGGQVYSTTVDSGGYLVVLPGGIVNSPTVLLGGEIISTGVVVYQPGFGAAVLGSSASDITLGSGAFEYILSGGIAVSTTMSSGGTEVVYSGGSASDATVSRGGTEIVYSSGRANDTTVSSGGTQVVSSGGTAISTTVSYGGVETVRSIGTASDTTLRSGGTEFVSPGGTARGITISSGGVAVISGYAAAASSTTIFNGGFEFVSAGGIARFTTVSSGGVADISYNGFAVSTTVSNGGTQSVSVGGRVDDTTVDSGGFQVVSGNADYTTVRSGGFEILAGHNAYGLSPIVDSGGYDAVYPGAQSYGTTVSSGGYVVVLPGGLFTQPALTDGEIVVISSGVWLVSRNAHAIPYGSSASGLSVSSGVIECVVSGGTASFTTVSSGGQELVSAGGTTMSTTVSGGGEEIISTGGTASFTTVSQGGADLVHSRGVTVSTTVSNGGVEYVFSAGSASYTTLKSNGSMTVGDGGTAIDTTVSSGGIETIHYSGTARSTVVSNGGVEFVSATGETSSTTVDSGGAEIVCSSGTAVSTTVDSGGYLVVLPDGFSISPNVLPGGEIVSTGVLIYQPGSGVAVLGSSVSDIALGSGVFEYILPGGSAVGTTVSSGGTEVVYSGGSASDTTVSRGGSIDVAYLPYGGGTASVDSTTDVLTVSLSTQSYTQQLAGDYTDEYFQLAPDAGGGTQVTLEGTPCYCRGTRILTHRGEVAVEDLRIGDRLKTLSGALRKLRWIGRRSYAGRFAAANPDILPVLIRRDALGDGTPRRDLYVSPLHAMYLDDVLIPAVLLVNGASIQQVAAIEQVEYFHLELATHDVILAEGAASETFVDDDSRGMFHNAAEYRLLYPNAPRPPARYYAPRVEDGELLEAVRQRLAARAQPQRHDAGVAPGHLLGCLEYVGADRATGWARDLAAPDRPVWLRILDNGSAVGLIAADQHREALWRTGLGDGRCGFEIVFPGGLSPLTRHVIRVERASDGMELPTSPWSVGGASVGGASVGGALGGGVRGAPAEPAAPIGALRGQLDAATRDRIAGWAQDAAFPDMPVALQVLDNNVPIARVLANHVRGDLAEAGFGAGRHGFEIVMPGGLSPQARHVIRVRREADSAELPGSPAVIEAAGSFDAGLQQAIARAVAAIGPDDDQDHALSFILGQADRLLQQRADAESRRTQRLAHRWGARRWGTPAPGLATTGLATTGLATSGLATPADPGLRALVIDHRVPAAGRDAGSQALLSHVGALQRLGYAVSFVAADEMAPDEADVAALTALGVAGCVAPFYASAEDVLRRQADCFDVVYLHRVGVATRYLGLARHYMPRARVLYSVADLHHVRLERQAAVEQRPELLAVSRRMRLEECMAAWSADAVLTHSAEEAELLRRAVPEANVYRVPWQVAGVGGDAAGATAPAGGDAAAGSVPGGRALAERATGERATAGRVTAGGATSERATAGRATTGRATTARPAAIRQFAARRGLVFVGSYAHSPNVDAACWLVEAVMPLVRQVDPDIVCLLVGSAMPEVVRRLARPGVVPLGEVVDLGSVFARVRLSVAPLRYGAGVKGKVLDSLAAGVPCVMTPIAAEGLGLPAGLRALVSEDAARFAKLICRLHRSEAAHRKAVRAGQAMIRKNHNETVVTAALRAAIEGRGVAVGSMKDGARTSPAVPADRGHVGSVGRPRRIA